MKLAESTQKRFGHIFDSLSIDFHPAYTLAALFDPSEILQVNLPMDTIKFLLGRCTEKEHNLEIEIKIFYILNLIIFNF